jgi:plasmid maintenance system antidote protein VapI
LAKAADVPARRINEIVRGQRRITADTALRLSRYFGTSERFLLNLQARYGLETEKDRLGAELDGTRLSAERVNRSGQTTPPGRTNEAPPAIRSARIMQVK